MPCSHTPSSSLPLAMRVAKFLKENEKLKAVQEYRNETGSPLKECFAFVESVLRGIELTNKGCAVDEKPSVIVVPDYVKRVQDVVLANVSKPSGTTACKRSVMEVVGEYSPDLVPWAVGEFGKRLLAFTQRVYSDHPSLADINSATLLEGGKVYERVSETMQWATLARDRKFKEMPEVLRKWFDRNHQKISKVMQKPPARLLKDPEARKVARNASQHKEIELGHIYEKGRRDTWDMCAEDFVPYTRMGPGFQKQIDYYKRMSGHLKILGMTHYAKCLESDVATYDDVLTDRYMGFIRIKMADAVMIAAKAMGAKWVDGRPSRICVQASSFKRAFWARDAQGHLGNNPLLSDVFDKHVLLDANYRQSDGTELKFALTPRVYPLTSFASLMPPNAQRIIEAIDSHPDANGYPLFDNYWVVVPGVTIGDTSNTFQFSDGQQTFKFLDYWEFAHALDRYLIEQGQIFPVILGEHVSLKACYFIGYWV